MFSSAVWKKNQFSENLKSKELILKLFQEKMLIRVPILLIWTWIDQISTWIDQIRLENSFEKPDFKLLAFSFVVIVSINFIRITLKKIVKSIRGGPVPAAKTSVQTNCQRDATCPIIEEIKSTDDFVNEGPDDQGK